MVIDNEMCVRLIADIWSFVVNIFPRFDIMATIGGQASFEA